MTGRSLLKGQVSHETFESDEAREHDGMVDELAHADQSPRTLEDRIVGKQGRSAEDDMHLLVPGGLI